MTDETREIEIEPVDEEAEAERVRLTAERVKAENEEALDKEE